MRFWHRISWKFTKQRLMFIIWSCPLNIQRLMTLNACFTSKKNFFFSNLPVAVALFQLSVVSFMWQEAISDNINCFRPYLQVKQQICTMDIPLQRIFFLPNPNNEQNCTTQTYRVLGKALDDFLVVWVSVSSTPICQLATRKAHWSICHTLSYLQTPRSVYHRTQNHKQRILVGCLHEQLVQTTGLWLKNKQN